MEDKTILSEKEVTKKLIINHIAVVFLTYLAYSVISGVLNILKYNYAVDNKLVTVFWAISEIIIHFLIPGIAWKFAIADLFGTQKRKYKSEDLPNIIKNIRIYAIVESLIISALVIFVTGQLLLFLIIIIYALLSGLFGMLIFKNEIIIGSSEYQKVYSDKITLFKAIVGIACILMGVYLVLIFIYGDREVYKNDHININVGEENIKSIENNNQDENLSSSTKNVNNSEPVTIQQIEDVKQIYEDLKIVGTKASEQYYLAFMDNKNADRLVGFTVELFNQYCHSKAPVSISRTQVEERGVFQDAINGEYHTKNNNHFCFTILATGEINSIRLVNDNGESEMLSWAFEK